jgi:hypothetical protein
VQFDNHVVYVITEGSRSSESASSASVQKQESWILPKIAEIESGRKLYTQFAPPTEFALDLSYEKKVADIGIACSSSSLAFLAVRVLHQQKNFFLKYSINADTHICIGTHSYKHSHIYSTSMSTSEKLSRLDLEIHEVGH